MEGWEQNLMIGETHKIHMSAPEWRDRNSFRKGGMVAQEKKKSQVLVIEIAGRLSMNAIKIPLTQSKRPIWISIQSLTLLLL